MATIRHIAYRAEDTEAMASFFVKGLGLSRIQRRGNGAIDLSDGTLNITILPMAIPRGDGKAPRAGIEHIGFTVADEPAAQTALIEAGAREMNRIDMVPVNYEVKFVGPEDIEIDLGNWAGAASVEGVDGAPRETVATH